MVTTPQGVGRLVVVATGAAQRCPVRTNVSASGGDDGVGVAPDALVGGFMDGGEMGAAGVDGQSGAPRAVPLSNSDLETGYSKIVI
jgi:hypothetical protein